MSDKNMNDNKPLNQEQPKNKSIIDKFKAMKTEDKVIIGVVAVIVVAILCAFLGSIISPYMEKRHQAQLRVEANMPECVHIQEAEKELYEMKERLKDAIEGDFDSYWKSYEQNFWKEFRKLHIQNHPDCFAAQNGQ